MAQPPSAVGLYPSNATWNPATARRSTSRSPSKSKAPNRARKRAASGISSDTKPERQRGAPRSPSTRLPRQPVARPARIIGLWRWIAAMLAELRPYFGRLIIAVQADNEIYPMPHFYGEDQGFAEGCATAANTATTWLPTMRAGSPSTGATSPSWPTSTASIPIRRTSAAAIWRSIASSASRSPFCRDRRVSTRPSAAASSLS